MMSCHVIPNWWLTYVSSMAILKKYNTQLGPRTHRSHGPWILVGGFRLSSDRLRLISLCLGSTINHLVETMEIYLRFLQPHPTTKVVSLFVWTSLVKKLQLVYFTFSEIALDPRNHFFRELGVTLPSLKQPGWYRPMPRRYCPDPQPPCDHIKFPPTPCGCWSWCTDISHRFS